MRISKMTAGVTLGITTMLVTAPAANAAVTPGDSTPLSCASGSSSDWLANLVGGALPPAFAGICQHLTGAGLTNHSAHGIFDTP